MRASARALVGMVAAALLVVTTACGSGTGDDEDTAPDDDTEARDVEQAEGESEDGTTTTTSPDTPEAEAVAAYERAWQAMFTASNPPNPMHPIISESLTGVAAETIIGIVIEQQNAGQYTEGSMATRPEVVSVTGSEVLLRDCTVETSTTYDAATGAVVEDGPGPPRTREVEVVNQDGTWRVSEIRTLEDPCTP